MAAVGTEEIGKLWSRRERRRRGYNRTRHMTTKWTTHCRIHQRRRSREGVGEDKGLPGRGVGGRGCGNGRGRLEMDGREVYVGAYKADDSTV